MSHVQQLSQNENPRAHFFRAVRHVLHIPSMVQMAWILGRLLRSPRVVDDKVLYEPFLRIKRSLQAANVPEEVKRLACGIHEQPPDDILRKLRELSPVWLELK